MNYAGFQIKDVGYEDIRGCAAFEYRGYIVSMSNIFNPPNVAILRADDKRVFIQVNTVEEAINAINSLE